MTNNENPATHYCDTCGKVVSIGEIEITNFAMEEEWGEKWKWEPICAPCAEKINKEWNDILPLSDPLFFDPDQEFEAQKDGCDNWHRP